MMVATVCIDEVNLGTLQPGEFFGELSLLPLIGGWRSQRTITAVQNAMLYYISKAKIEWLASRFSDLKHKLHDHAEDYEKILCATPPRHATVRHTFLF
jgi:CRP-like cAMP-binding protein